MARITPPDGAAWTIDVERLDGGLVGLVLAFDIAGTPHCVTLGMDRPDSRTLARAILAAAGDATERTFTGGSGVRHG